MARKPENQFILSVHRYLPDKETMHREKMNNPYSSGTADWWYSGNRHDLWVEYKYLPKLPVRAEILPDLTELQKDWLDGRHREGRNVAVVVGCPQGAVIYRGRRWHDPLQVDEFRSLMITKQELARWLVEQTTIGAEYVETTVGNSKGRRRSVQDRLGT